MSTATTLDGRGIFDLFAGQREAVIAAAALSLGLAGIARAAPAPTVTLANHITGNLALMGGTTDHKATGLAAASLSLPLAGTFGVQLDALGGIRDGDGLKGFDGQAFMRVPATGLLGITAQRVGVASRWASRFGAEAAYYLPSMTFAATAGWQNGAIAHSAYGTLDAILYPTPNLALDLGGSVYKGRHDGRIGIEWRPGLAFAPGLTGFAVGDIGNAGFHYVLAGLRIGFGGSGASLQTLQRQGPLANPLPDFAAHLTTPAGTGAQASGSNPGNPGPGDF